MISENLFNKFLGGFKDNGTLKLVCSYEKYIDFLKTGHTLSSAQQEFLKKSLIASKATKIEFGISSSDKIENFNEEIRNNFGKVCQLLNSIIPTLAGTEVHTLNLIGFRRAFFLRKSESSNFTNNLINSLKDTPIKCLYIPDLNYSINSITSNPSVSKVINKSEIVSAEKKSDNSAQNTNNNATASTQGAIQQNVASKVMGTNNSGNNNSNVPPLRFSKKANNSDTNVPIKETSFKINAQDNNIPYEHKNIIRYKRVI